MENILNKLKEFVKNIINQPVDTRFLKYYSKFWDFVGLWPAEENTKKWLLQLRYIYPRSVVILSCFNIALPCCVHIYKNYNNLLILTEVILTIFLGVQTSMKILTYISQEEKFKCIYDQFEQLHKSQIHGNIDEQSVLKKSKFISKLLSKYLTVSSTVTVFLLFQPVLAYFVIKRIVPFEGWYPCKDYTASPCFESIIFYQLVILITSFHSIMLTDVLLFDILTTIWAQFTILHQNLTNIRQYAHEKLGGTLQRDKEEGCYRSLRKENDFGRVRKEIIIETKELREIRISLTDTKGTEMKIHSKSNSRNETDSTPQIKREMNAIVNINSNDDTSTHSSNYRTSHEIGNTKMDFDKIVYKKTHRHLEEDTPSEIASNFHQRKAKLDVIKLQAEQQKKAAKLMNLWMEERLANCVSHHVKLLRLVTDVEKVFQPLFIIQLFCNAVPYSLGLLYFMLIPSLKVKDLVPALSIIIVAAELFTFCFLSHQITAASSRVREAIYSCDWLTSSESFKRSMRIVMSMANQPTVISVGSFFPLSMPTFAEAMHMSYRYFMVMKCVQEK